MRFLLKRSYMEAPSNAGHEKVHTLEIYGNKIESRQMNEKVKHVSREVYSGQDPNEQQKTYAQKKK